MSSDIWPMPCLPFVLLTEVGLLWTLLPSYLRIALKKFRQHHFSRAMTRDTAAPTVTAMAIVHILFLIYSTRPQFILLKALPGRSLKEKRSGPESCFATAKSVILQYSGLVNKWGRKMHQC